MKTLLIILLGIFLISCEPPRVGDNSLLARETTWSVTWKGHTYTNCEVYADSYTLRIFRKGVDNLLINWQNIDTITITKE